MRSVLSFTLGLAIVAAASVAGAQDMGGTTTVTTNQVPPSTVTTSGESVTTTSGATDHSVVAGHIGLRYFGASSLPALSGGSSMGMAAPTADATIQTVGIRYWLNGNLGLDLGLSLGIRSGSNTVQVTNGMGTTTTSVDNPSFFGFGLVAAVPLMLAESKHVSIHLDPFLALAFGRSAITTDSGVNTTDTSQSAFQFGVGGNIAAELQFGFLGVPQLALQGQFGLALQFRSQSQTVDRPSMNFTASSSQSGLSVGTTFGPGYGLADIISGSISAVWYFGGQPGSQH